jgi:predicted Rossmann fold nucleotide-binding protein DprA/Smf involved in DNA uptake
MNVGIVGSRSVGGTDKWFSALSIIVPKTVERVVSGGAIGADRLGAAWADKYDIPTTIHKPDWAKYGKSAGFQRNTTIVSDSDVIIALWDGESRGTLDTMQKAVAAGKQVMVVTEANGHMVFETNWKGGEGDE